MITSRCKSNEKTGKQTQNIRLKERFGKREIERGFVTVVQVLLAFFSNFFVLLTRIGEMNGVSKGLTRTDIREVSEE